ncbi:ParA family protein [Microbacterium immunditiarum]|uniref:Chromosome partitioning protein n=1 Tax=Microbacterium immunditiarum TaxID=337480 RepID=A0A7Y9GK88_9MICO|nr:ParA family protein [Microbacterium immunditiarum]NYE18058.1 chromosome partitioning protein [Microbacterium immunditiarum]
MKTIAIANQKGGVGKTTVTMQLAATLSRRHRVLVVDVDPQRSTMWWAENAVERLPFDFAGSQQPGVLARLHRLDIDYDFVVVDTPGNLEAASILETVLDAADFVLVPQTPEPLAVDPTERTIQRLIEPRGLRYSVLLNRIDPRIPSQLKFWTERLDTDWGVPRFETHWRQYKIHAEAPVLGQLVTSIPDNQRNAGLIADVTRLGYEMVEQFATAGVGM